MTDMNVYGTPGQAARSRSSQTPFARMMIDLPLSVIFFGCLSFSYAYLSHFLGFQYFEFRPDPVRMQITAVAIFATAAIMPGRKTMHSFAMCLMVYALWLPLLVWYTFGGASGLQVSVTAAAMIGLRLFGFVRMPRLVLPPLAPRWIILATMISGSLLALWALAANGFSSVNLLIYAVYDFRRDAADGLPGIFQYLWPQVANAMIPLAVALCLAQRRWVGFACLCVIAVALFAVIHHKGVLFTPIFAAIVFFLFKRRDDLTLFKLAFVGAAAIGALEAVILMASQADQIGVFNLLFSRRVFLVPAQLDGLYFEYFEQNAKYYWSASRITFGLVDMPYDVSAPRVIGEYYFGRFGISSNTGFIGAGFANGGLFGVAAYTIILGSALCLLEAHARALGHAVVITASILIIHNALTASDTVTLMLTGGFGTLVLLFSVLRRSS